MKVGLGVAQLLLVAAGLLGVGCSGGLERFEARRVAVAPQTAQDVGVLVRGASEDKLAALLSANANVRFRALSERHQLYELYGITVKQARGELPSAHVTRNEFFPLGGPRPADRIRFLASESKTDDLEKCQEGETPPEAVLTIISPEKELGEQLLKRGTTVELDASKSVNTNFPGKPLKTAWIVLSPKGAKQIEQVFPGEQLKINVDALGAYGVGLVVQDERKVCNLDLLEFAVTADADYAGPGDGKITDTDLSKMKHLAEFKVTESWKYSTGLGMTIAILDSGVHFNHPALRRNILLNEKEIENGVDDDGNGHIDDIVGWDFSYGDASPFDDVGHGSHVAGLAASSQMGLAKDAKILAVKAMGAFGGDAGTIAAGIRYAVDRGAKIINLSVGSYNGPNEELIAAVDYAESRNVLLVAAAGNGHPMTGIGLSTDETPHYPSTLPNPNMLTVAAKGTGDQLASYSNFGSKTVHVAAPGGEVDDPLFSCFLDNPAGIEFEGMDGTSMAAPIIAGLAAQVWAQNPGYSAVQVKQTLMRAGRIAPELKGFVQSERWLDALAAVRSNL